jgi:NAD-dependent deacetylase
MADRERELGDRVNTEYDFERAAALIRQSRHMIALTGAGHSTPSGIPDFRSPHSGLWEKANPMLVASIWAFRLNPKTFYEWIRPLVRTLFDASPNAAHVALADLEAMGYLKAVITQNIDNLHQRAGSRRVLELHGHLREATCTRCYRVVPIDPVLEQTVLSGRIPHCECGGVLKPNVILFGEQLPVRVFNEAMAEAQNCDLILIAGSSLEVTPAADIPFVALESGAKAIVVNFEPTCIDDRADVVIHGDVAVVLPAIVDAVKRAEGMTQEVNPGRQPPSS